MKPWPDILLNVCAIALVVFCGAMFAVLIVRPFIEWWPEFSLHYEDLKSSDFAAWVQAVGTIAVFSGAIYFSGRDHRRAIKIFEFERDRDEGIRHLRAHSLAHGIFPDLLEIKAKIKSSQASINRQLARHDFLNPINEITDGWIIDIPNGFGSDNGSFFYLGTKTAPVVTQLLTLLNQHNRVAEEMIKQLSNENTLPAAHAKFNNNDLFKNRLELLRKGVEEALELVGKIRNREIIPEYTWPDKTPDV